ncbi:D-2-hydroxyacid dehydrogenase [Paenibacillus sp. LMG 31456]|uniref:D-2-hydroxyacid dehydrogenase n=1 Tax=Paenibacillus foliorum TaxID=2654974 RepID=A0A972GZB6_9BACL|nr:D-2-hydroxyacid dehydrogenase [Paenibacillus foliorum]NOU96572.1 D-2-hydroxyacid dehydrogenase [Paenibacillus foliorum]
MARKIVSVHTFSSAHEEQIRQVAPDWEFINGKGSEQWLAHLADAEILVGWSSAVVPHCLQPGTRLRWAQNWGAGVDKIPLEALAESGVMLTNASGVHPNPISETVLAMMLSLTRQIHRAIGNQLQNKWASLGELGEMHGKTVGIIGVGAIGTEVAKLCKAFGMKVLGVKRTLSESENVDRMVTMNGLDEVLRESDYVVVTLPLTKDTKHSIGSRQFELMKPTAYYINIGRGGTTDEHALVEALRSGGIAGAGLDVFEVEPLPETSPLWEMSNVIMTPHNSGSTVYYNERALDIFLHNLRDYVEGKEPQLNRVDLRNQY